MHFQLHPGYFHLEIPALPGIQVLNPPVFLVPSSLILSLPFLWCRESLFSKSATVETSVVFIFSLAESLSAFYGFITYLLNFLTSIRRKHKKVLFFLNHCLQLTIKILPSLNDICRRFHSPGAPCTNIGQVFPFPEHFSSCNYPPWLQSAGLLTWKTFSSYLPANLSLVFTGS